MPLCRDALAAHACAVAAVPSCAKALRYSTARAALGTRFTPLVCKRCYCSTIFTKSAAPLLFLHLQKLIGSVVEVSSYAAFLDCGVSRIASGGKRISVDGFLHKTDTQLPYALEGTPRSNKVRYLSFKHL
jgi:hypothetical protein